ncbi:MAG: extracellular solute-binding protein [Candidatus Eremiobacteraeota bacterium]|nr:extracellular solute-binding protein [Candidatus Eremiobacteraeota bacterium]
MLYAGSLVTPMEGPVKAALRALGIDFQGEPGGSKKLANFIESGVRSPDVFISADPALVKKLGSRVADGSIFATTSLGIVWSTHSNIAARVFAQFSGMDLAPNAEKLENALMTPGLKIGRTDPALDPKGQYTIEDMKAWLGPDGERRLLGDDGNPAQIYPEEELLARLDTGEIDAGFFYRTEAVARNAPFVALPPEAAAAQIKYTLAVMNDAPHPAAARAFTAFVLDGEGRAILTKAGLTYFTVPGNP